MVACFYLKIGFWPPFSFFFLFLIIPFVESAILENKIGPIDRNHSTDSYLSGLIHVRNGSQLFSNLLEAVPPEKSFVIFVDVDSSPSQFLGMLVAYLSRPHDVRVVQVRGATLDRATAGAKSSSITG